MTERDGLQDEMRRLLLGELGSCPLAIDQDTADRLLAGRLDPADAPPGYAEVASVLATAAAPTTPHELDGEATAMAVFASEQLGRLGADSHAAPRRRLGSRLAVVAVAVSVLMVGGVAAAATGTLPEPAKRLVDSVSRTAYHLGPWSSSQQGDGGTARRSGQDQRPAVGGGHGSGQPGQGRHAVGAGSTGRGATGGVGEGAHGASPAEQGGAHGKNRSAASRAATPTCGTGKVDSCPKETPPGRQSGASESGLRQPATGTGGAVGAPAEGHRKEKGE